MNRTQIPIPEPCCADWNEMTGDDQRRFCSHCEKDVVNLSALTEVEVFHFLRQAKNPCVRYICSDDGQVYFVSPQLRRQRMGLKRLLAAAAAIPLSLGIGLFLEPSPEPPLPQCSDMETPRRHGAGQLHAFAVNEEGQILVKDSEGCVDYLRAVLPLGGAGGVGDFRGAMNFGYLENPFDSAFFEGERLLQRSLEMDDEKSE